MAGEIATVDRGNIFRLQPAQIPRVVPVIKMTAKPFELAHGGQGRLQPLHHVERALPAEIARRDNGKQIKPDIRGRGSVRHDRIGIFLKVVGWQHVVFGGHEGFKIAPCPAGDQAQGNGISLGDRHMTRGGRRTARQPCHHGRQRPQRQNGHGDGPGVEAGEDENGGGEGGARGELPPQHGSVEPRVLPGLRGGGPFQQVSARDELTVQGADHGVGHQPALMREENEQKPALRQPKEQVFLQASQVISHRHARSSGHDAGDDRQQRRKRDHDEQKPGPCQCRGERQQPTHDEREKGRGRGQRTAQIIKQFPASDRGHRVSFNCVARPGASAKNPGEQLPVATGPTMLTRGHDGIQ